MNRVWPDLARGPRGSSVTALSQPARPALKGAAALGLVSWDLGMHARLQLLRRSPALLALRSLSLQGGFCGHLRAVGASWCYAAGPAIHLTYLGCCFPPRPYAGQRLDSRKMPTCTITNTILFRGSDSFLLFFLKYYCIGYCTCWRFSLFLPVASSYI